MGKQFSWTALDTVNSEVTALQAVVDTLKNTDVAQLSANVNGIQTENKYTPWNYDVMTLAIPTANTWVTGVNITGKGYLEEAVLDPVGNTFKMRITVDGVDKFIYIAGSSYPGGILQFKNIGNYSGNMGTKQAGGQGFYNITGAVDKSYPNPTAVNADIILSQPIYFNTSLQIAFTITTGTGNAIWRANGGAI